MSIRRALLYLPLAAALAFAQGGTADTPQPRNLQIVLLIGQSNMAGRGAVEDQDRAPVPRVWSLNKELAWVPAADPLHWDKPEIAGVGMGRSVARTLLMARPSASIGLVPSAFGGTALDLWKPGADLYENAVRRARAAMKSGTLRAILWHQGESDTNKEELARTYDERFAAMIARLRSDLGAPDVPVVVGQMGEFFGTAPGSLASVVNEQLALVPLRVPRSAFVTSHGLRDKGDKVHFDSASYRELGQRYAGALLSLDPSWWER